MIEISVRSSDRELDVIITGHADYADYGKDVVCAGVSTLFYTLLNYSVLHCETDYRVSDGVCRLRAGRVPEEIVTFFATGVQMIEEHYPDCVRVSID